MIVVQLPVGLIQANCYLVVDEPSRHGIVIDPGGDADIITSRIAELGFHVDCIVLTHGHFDHLGALGTIQAATRGLVAIPEADLDLVRSAKLAAQAMAGLDFLDAPMPDRLLHDGDRIAVGGQTLRVVATPGHSPGHVVLIGDGMAFVGDLVFAGGVGRTDLPGGNPKALMQSISKHILTLPDTTTLYPGHGPATTVGAERRTNPFLRSLAPD